MSLSSSSLWTRVPKPLQRRLARWLGRKSLRIAGTKPLISFTFDDFPRSALHRGGAILREHGFAATYYASFGLMGRVTATGEIFSRHDFEEFVRQQHELGCHTFDHCDSWDTSPADFEGSIIRNQQRIAQELPGLKLSSLSYPISYPRPETKRRTAKHYQCARGAGQTFNRGLTDLNYLKAFFLEQSRDDWEAIQRMIDLNSQQSGWLIFATHDVCDSPTRFGCTPRLFLRVVEYAARSGAAVLPVSLALHEIGQQSWHKPQQRSLSADIPGSGQKETDRVLAQ